MTSSATSSSSPGGGGDESRGHPVRNRGRTSRPVRTPEIPERTLPTRKPASPPRPGLAGGWTRQSKASSPKPTNRLLRAVRKLARHRRAAQALLLGAFRAAQPHFPGMREAVEPGSRTIDGGKRRVPPSDIEFADSPEPRQIVLPPRIGRPVANARGRGRRGSVRLRVRRHVTIDIGVGEVLLPGGRGPDRRAGLRPPRTLPHPGPHDVEWGAFSGAARGCRAGSRRRRDPRRPRGCASRPPRPWHSGHTER